MSFFRGVGRWAIKKIEKFKSVFESVFLGHDFLNMMYSEILSDLLALFLKAGIDIEKCGIRSEGDNIENKEGCVKSY